MPTTTKVRQYTEGTDWDFTVTDAAGAAVDLTSATITFQARRTQSDNDADPDIEGACSSSGQTPASGECHYTWAAGDLDVPATYECWLWIVDGTEKFGNREPFLLEVVPSPPEP